MIARLLISPSQETLCLNLSGYRTNHPDTLYIKAGEKLGIAEARKIKEHFFLKPYSAKGRSVIIEDASVMTDEAQNALLKTIEELPRNAVFILGTTSDINLVPTILSRCQIVYLPNSKGRSENQDVEKLVGLNIEERFEYIEKLKEKEDFLHTLILFFRQKLIEDDTHARSDLTKLKITNFLKELLQAEEWAKQNVNSRAILEYLMLVMPRDI